MFIDVKREGPDDGDADDRIPGQLAIVRWQYRFLGWHCLTLYRHDIHLPSGFTPEGAAEFVETNHIRHWWLYPVGDLGFGLHVPVWLAKKLGIGGD